ncbi:hypothetical protein BDV12DRAFT_202409 [Aspergillus spectabilis]
MLSATTFTETKRPELAINANLAGGEWRDEFFRNGYYVFKQAVPKEKALEDRSTWTKEHLPQSFKSMYINYCAAHEEFMWDARNEPGVISPLEPLWGTKELLVSFDTFNISLSNPNAAPSPPWPHTDQSPYRKGLSCVQGILSLSPAGPKDGRLLLMIGCYTLFEKYFETFSPRERKTQSNHYDLYRFQPDEI